MSKYEIFDIGQAQRLRMLYKKNRQEAKKNFLEELISYQYFFGNQTSIVGAKLSVVHCYRKKTVETVLNDLNYKLSSFSTPLQRGLYGEAYGRCTNFCFVPKDSQTTEG